MKKLQMKSYCKEKYQPHEIRNNVRDRPVGVRNPKFMFESMLKTTLSDLIVIVVDWIQRAVSLADAKPAAFSQAHVFVLFSIMSLMKPFCNKLLRNRKLPE